MEDQILVYFILLIAFISGSIYNFRIRKQCIYPVKFTKPRIIILIIMSLVFCGIAYIGGNLWRNCLLAILAILFVISGIVGEGIQERGIYYSLGRGPLLRLAKWEEIKEIKIDTDKNKLKSFKLKTKTIFLNQYYNPEDIDEINEYIKTHKRYN